MNFPISRDQPFHSKSIDFDFLLVSQFPSLKGFLNISILLHDRTSKGCELLAITTTCELCGRKFMSMTVRCQRSASCLRARPSVAKGSGQWRYRHPLLLARRRQKTNCTLFPKSRFSRCFIKS